MRTVNKVILIGNITRDPTVKTTESGKKVALFTIATNRYYKTSEGEQKSESEFHNSVAWGNLAERCEKFLNKGKLVYVEGRLKTYGTTNTNEDEELVEIEKEAYTLGNITFRNWEDGIKNK